MNRIRKNKGSFISIILAFLLLFPVCSVLDLRVYGAGPVLSCDRETRPGGTVSIRLDVPTAAEGFEGYFSFDSSVWSLKGVTPANGKTYSDFFVSTTDGFVKVTHASPVRQMLIFTFTVSANAPVGTELSFRIRRANAIRPSGNESLDDASCTVKVTQKKSSDATLSALVLSVYTTESDRNANENGFFANLSPAFSSNTDTYSVTVPHSYAYYRVRANTSDAHAKVVLPDGLLVFGLVTPVTVVVTAEDGTKATYTLNVFREQEQQQTGTGSDPDPSDDPSQPSEPTPGEVDTSSEVSEINESDPSEAETNSTVSIDFTEYEETESFDWTGIFIIIGVIGLLALIGLILRIFMLFRKKQSQ